MNQHDTEADDSQSPDSQPGKSGLGFWGSLQESLRGSDQDFTTGSLNRAVGLLAVPMVLEMAGESLFAICDAFFVARLGSEALAAVGLTESLLELIYALAIGLSMATTAIVARRIGEKRLGDATRVSAQAIILGVIVAAVIGTLGALFGPQLLGLMGATEETVAIGSNYTRILYGGMVTILLLFINNAIYRASGDAITAMRALWIANIINLILDPCLIFGLGPFPELGLMGAAIATTTGRSIGVMYQFWGFTRGSRLQIHLADIRLDLKLMGGLLRVSAGGVAQMLVATGSYVGLVRILATFGSQVLAGYVVAIRVVLFVLLPAWGLSNAAATLVGQNLGAGRPDRAERSVWITGTWTMAFMAIVTILLVAFTPQVIGVFAKDPEVLAIGVQALRTISYGYVFYAWGMVTLQAFNGAGDTRTPTWISLICFWMFQIPVAWFLALRAGWGPSGVFWAIALSYSLEAVIGMILFRRGRWKQKKV